MAELDKLISVDGLHVIDAGCGSMPFSKALAQRGAKVLAIDPDPIQAKLNREAQAIPGIEFVEAGADQLPAEDASIDGILFSYSLHHVPAELYPEVFKEAARVLKPSGFFCAVEPVAEGKLNEVMSLFHDEKEVRAKAQQALDTLGADYFSEVEVSEYVNVDQFTGWEQYASHYVKASYNTHYTDAEVTDEKVQSLFENHGKPLGYRFERPMKITVLRNLK
jgi:ubiquinone/menaquinone biosynthesis C-methylase UbiE